MVENIQVALGLLMVASLLFALGFLLKLWYRMYVLPPGRVAGLVVSRELSIAPTEDVRQSVVGFFGTNGWEFVADKSDDLLFEFRRGLARVDKPDSGATTLPPRRLSIAIRPYPERFSVKITQEFCGATMETAALWAAESEFREFREYLDECHGIMGLES